MANLVEVYCKKCGENFKLNIGAHTKEEVIDMLHWDSLEEEKVPTEAEWIADFKAKHEAYTHQELEEKFEITGFAYGACHAIDKVTNEERYFDFATSPQGKRLYY
jgi:hypothetical protein